MLAGYGGPKIRSDGSRRAGDQHMRPPDFRVTLHLLVFFTCIAVSQTTCGVAGCYVELGRLRMKYACLTFFLWLAQHAF